MLIDQEGQLKQSSELSCNKFDTVTEKSTPEPFEPMPLLKVVSLSESSETPAKDEKYYKKFDFFYRRTAFRSMTEFYKGLFKPTLDKWREGERKSTKNFVQQFICKNANLISFNKSQDFKKIQCLVNQN
jgi:hypothetical protein